MRLPDSLDRGRRAEPRIEDEALVEDLRDWWAQAEKRRPGTRDLLLREMPASGSNRAYLPARALRWWQRAYSELVDLSRTTAIEVLLRFRRCGFVVPDHLAERLQRIEPAVLMFPEAGAELADRIFEIVALAQRRPLGDDAKNKIRDYLIAFENVGKHGIVKKALYLVKSGLRKQWRARLTQARHAFSIPGRAKPYGAPKAIQMLENEFIARESAGNGKK